MVFMDALFCLPSNLPQLFSLELHYFRLTNLKHHFLSKEYAYDLKSHMLLLCLSVAIGIIRDNMQID